MKLIRKNVFHIFTVMTFSGLLFHCRESPDTLGWGILFLLIILNAVFFIFKKPISMISWITILVGILGIIMCMPEIISSGISYLQGTTETQLQDAWTYHPAWYFMATIFFSFFQIIKLIR